MQLVGSLLCHCLHVRQAVQTLTRLAHIVPLPPTSNFAGAELLLLTRGGEVPIPGDIVETRLALRYCVLIACTVCMMSQSLQMGVFGFEKCKTRRFCTESYRWTCTFILIQGPR